MNTLPELNYRRSRREDRACILCRWAHLVVEGDDVMLKCEVLEGVQVHALMMCDNWDPKGDRREDLD